MDNKENMELFLAENVENAEDFEKFLTENAEDFEKFLAEEAKDFGTSSQEDVIPKDIELKMFDAEELNAILKEYISNDACNVIFTVSDKNLEMAKEDEEFNECLLKADLLLSSSNLKNEESSEGSEAGVDVEIINKIASDEEVDALSIMLLTDDRDFADIYDAKMEEVFTENEYAEYVGNFVISEDIDDDLLINEINGKIPDVLVCVCESPVQEKWIMQNKSKIGVKIILALTSEKEEFLQKKENGINFLAKLFGKR